MEDAKTNGAPVVLGLAVSALAIMLYVTHVVAPGYAVAGLVMAGAAPVVGLLRRGRLAFGIVISLAVLALAVGVVLS